MAKPRRTWLAVMVCVIAVIVPGIFVGGAVAFVYRLFSLGGPAPDPFGLSFLVGIDGPGRLLKWFFTEGLASAIHGGIAGFVAAGLTGLLFRQVILIAALVTGFLYSVFIVLLIAASVVTSTIDSNSLLSMLQLLGLWIGLIAGAAMTHKESPAI
jgi:hypothetical protein